MPPKQQVTWPDCTAAAISARRRHLEANSAELSLARQELLEGIRVELPARFTVAARVAAVAAQQQILSPVLDAILPRSAGPGSAEGAGAVLAGGVDDGLLDFVRTVTDKASETRGAAGRQQLLADVVGGFFAVAEPTETERDGVVYTPVTAADFLLRSVDAILSAEFGADFADPRVVTCDPFTGTGLFPARLMELGLAGPRPGNTLRVHELSPLAAHVAVRNLKSTAAATAAGSPTTDVLVADTFTVASSSAQPVGARAGNEPIRVVVGNPPYGATHRPGSYPQLDRAISRTYVARSAAANRSHLYDAGIRAVKWATEWIGHRGVLAYVTNGGWIDSIAADGMRQTLVDECSAIHVFNLRGNALTSGTARRHEGDNIFGDRCKTTVAVVVLVKHPEHRGPASINYAEVDTGLSQAAKLDLLSSSESIAGVGSRTIVPNSHGDWINQRKARAAGALPLIDRPGDPGIFTLTSQGQKTNRDAWAVNFSAERVTANMSSMLDCYEAERAARAANHEHQACDDPGCISWSRTLQRDFRRGVPRPFHPEAVVPTMHRPFIRSWTYFDRHLNDMVYRLPDLFPAGTTNHGFYIPAPGAGKPFSVLAVDAIPNISLYGSNAGHLFARYRWTVDEQTGERIRHDNITQYSLAVFRDRYGERFGHDEVFAYCYGLLHSPDYRAREAINLRRELPCIPLADDPGPFIDAGRRLMSLHLHFESAPPHPAVTIRGNALSNVDQMRWTDKLTGDTLRAGDHLTITGIPREAHQYRLGTRSALQWVAERARRHTDKHSGLVNDAAEFSRLHRASNYWPELLSRLTTVSMETLQVVKALPCLDGINTRAA